VFKTGLRNLRPTDRNSSITVRLTEKVAVTNIVGNLTVYPSAP